MATGALNNPYFYTAKKAISKVDSIENIENVDDLVEHSLNIPLNLKSVNVNYKRTPEEAAIHGFINRMGADLTGPNFN
jgi:hypothetical protein